MSKRPSLKNLSDWNAAHARRIYGLEKEVNGNGKPGLREDVQTVQGSLSAVKIQLRYIIGIATFAIPLVLGIGGWIIVNQIEQGKAISALTAAMQGLK